MKPHKTVGVQYAALPYRLVGRRVEVMLLTSRDTRRWIIPKGWPMPGKSPAEAAAIEAIEEAGIVGEIEPTPVGSYKYLKRLKGERTIPVQVIVFAFKVTGQVVHWKEEGQREARWLPYGRASTLVDEPNLKRLIRELGRSKLTWLTSASTPWAALMKRLAASAAPARPPF